MPHIEKSHFSPLSCIVFSTVLFSPLLLALGCMYAEQETARFLALFGLFLSIYGQRHNSEKKKKTLSTVVGSRGGEAAASNVLSVCQS